MNKKKSNIKDELTTKMHSEFSIDNETEISHRVSCVVDELHEGFGTLEQLLEDYGVTKEQYEKHRLKWEKLIK